MTSPAHVHNDVHFSPPGPPIFNINDYEHWEFDNFFGPAGLSAWAGTAALIPAATDYGALLVATAKRTNEDVRIVGHLQRNTTTPATLDLATLFPPIAFLTYVAPTTGGIEERWTIANVGSCLSGPEQLPRPEDDWWRAEPRAAGEFYYLENVRNAIPAKVWDTASSTYVANASNAPLPLLWAGHPSQPNLRATPTQTGLLVPRTIEAGAGLLQLFESTVTVHVSSTTPRRDGVVVGSDPITVVFDRPMAIGSAILGDTVKVLADSAPVAGTLSWSADRTVLTVVPGAPWALKRFTLSLQADDPCTPEGVEGVRGANGEVLTQPLSLPFHHRDAGRLLFVSAGSGFSGTVLVYRLDGTLLRSVTGVDSPTDVAYDSATGVLFYTDLNSGAATVMPRVVRERLNGTERRELLTEFEPAGLAWDAAARRLYGSAASGFALFSVDENLGNLVQAFDRCPAIVGGVYVLQCTETFSNNVQRLGVLGGLLMVANDRTQSFVNPKSDVVVVTLPLTSGSTASGKIGVGTLSRPRDAEGRQVTATRQEWFVPDAGANDVFRFVLDNGVVSVVTTLPRPAGGWSQPMSATWDEPTQTLFVSDSSNTRIVKWDPAGNRSVVFLKNVSGPGGVASGLGADAAPPVVDQGPCVTFSTATVRWATTEPSDSRIVYSQAPTLVPGTVVEDPSLVLAHTLTLSGLAPFTTFFYQVTSRDASGNAAVTSIMSFITPEEVTGVVPGAFLQTGATVTVTNASGRVGKAEFFLDGAMQQTSSSTPFQWVVGPATDGVRALSVRVTSLAGAVAGTYAVTGPTVTFTPSGGWPTDMFSLIRAQEDEVGTPA